MQALAKADVIEGEIVDVIDGYKAQPFAEDFNGEALVRDIAEYAEPMHGHGQFVYDFESAEQISHNNSRRAGYALEALVRYARLTGDWTEQADVAIGDLLCDLRHLADALGVDWEEADFQGESHYVAEVNGR